MNLRAITDLAKQLETAISERDEAIEERARERKEVVRMWDYQMKAHEQLKVVQKRCTELLEEAREARAIARMSSDAELHWYKVAKDRMTEILTLKERQ